MVLSDVHNKNNGSTWTSNNHLTAYQEFIFKFLRCFFQKPEGFTILFGTFENTVQLQKHMWSSTLWREGLERRLPAKNSLYKFTHKWNFDQALHVQMAETVLQYEYIKYISSKVPKRLYEIYIQELMLGICLWTQYFLNGASGCKRIRSMHRGTLLKISDPRSSIWKGRRMGTSFLDEKDLDAEVVDYA